MVSLTLICCYGLLQIAVPPTVFGTQGQDTPLAATPDAQPAVEMVTQIGHATAPDHDHDAKPSMQ